MRREYAMVARSIPFSYYGDAVRAKAEPDSLRIAMEQLLVVAPGSILSCGHIAASQKELADES
jgi:hypothetical protein